MSTLSIHVKCLAHVGLVASPAAWCQQFTCIPSSTHTDDSSCIATSFFQALVSSPDSFKSRSKSCSNTPLEVLPLWTFGDSSSTFSHSSCSWALPRFWPWLPLESSTWQAIPALNQQGGPGATQGSVGHLEPPQRPQEVHGGLVASVGGIGYHTWPTSAMHCSLQAHQWATSCLQLLRGWEWGLGKCFNQFFGKNCL